MASSSAHQTRSGSRSSMVNALIGAAVAVVLGFIPFSPALGGLAAGYLDADKGKNGVRVGALSGLISMIPLALVIGGIIFLLSSFLSVLDLGFGISFGIIAIVAAIFGLFFLGLYTVGLGALGGYVGVELADREGGRLQQEVGDLAGGPGQSGQAGGQSGQVGGQTGTSAPGQPGGSAGQSGQTGGQSGQPGQTGGQPGQSGQNGGQSGRSDESGGQPGQSDDHQDDEDDDGDRTGGQRGGQL